MRSYRSNNGSLDSCQLDRQLGLGRDTTPSKRDLEELTRNSKGLMVTLMWLMNGHINPICDVLLYHLSVLVISLEFSKSFTWHAKITWNVANTSFGFVQFSWVKHFSLLMVRCICSRSSLPLVCSVCVKRDGRQPPAVRRCGLTLPHLS